MPSLGSQLHARSARDVAARLGVTLGVLVTLTLLAGAAYALTRTPPVHALGVGRSVADAVDSSLGSNLDTGGTPAASSAAGLDALLLQRGDLPASWVATPSTSTPDDPSGDAEYARCVGAGGSTAADEIASVQSDDFALGNLRISSSATKYRSHKAVLSDIAQLHQAATPACVKSELQKSLRADFPGLTVDLPTFTLTFGGAGFPSNVVAIATATVTVRKDGRQLTSYMSMGIIAGKTVEAEVDGFNNDAPVPASTMNSLITKVANRVGAK
jgi:hypothetical protein